MIAIRKRRLASLLILALAGIPTIQLAAAPRDSIVGAWKATATLADFGDIFQPNHGVRRRVAWVYFQQNGDKLTGHSQNPRGNTPAKLPEGQVGWNGQTEFSLIRFSNRMLLIEFIVDREGRKERIRIDAVLKDDKLLGRWRNLTTDGAEIFSGEWEAVPIEIPPNDLIVK